MTRDKLISFASIAAFSLLFANCKGNSQFGFSSIEDALASLPDDVGENVTILDTDGDGIGDAIDTDGDGDPDIIVNPTNPTPTPTPDPNNPNPTPTPTPDPNNPTPTPTPVPIRDGQGSCIVPVGSLKTISLASGNFSGSVSADNVFILPLSSSGNFRVANLNGSTVRRVIVDAISGSNNTIEVSGAVMTEGFCNNKASGNSNRVAATSVSAPIVDFLAGQGGSQSLISGFVPGTNLKYVLTGNNHCVQAPAGTTIDPASSDNGNGHQILIGSSCP